MRVIPTSISTFRATPSCSNLLLVWLARGLRLHCPGSFCRPTGEGFPATVAFHVGAWGRTEPHPYPPYQTPQQNPLTCLMRAAACRRLLRSATSSWSCCHSFWRLSVCLRMSSWRMGFFWLSSQPLLITSAHMALCELHSASRA